MVELSHAERMMNLFRGFADAHGTHGVTDRNSSKGGKLEIKKTARTIREPVTVDLWLEHLKGTRPLGIIPINEDNECVWGCIDVDRYDIDHVEAVKKLRSMNLPVVCCRTKSGGLHAFLFLKSPVPAEELRAVLSNIAASMGWGDCEIFPKQNQVLLERGDLGNWLNMPYLGGNQTERFAMKETMTAYSLNEFLEYAEYKRVELEDIPKVIGGKSKSRKQNANHEPEPTVPLADGPPCLQHLAQSGFPDGTRNNGLFALGIYAKKKYGEDWRRHLEEMNRDFMNPPLTSDEVLGVTRNLEKKEYNYSCRDQPLCSHCESAVCRGRKFGVGGIGQYPRISGLSKLESDPPLWFMDIEDQRIELNTTDLQDYRKFQHVCMERLTIFYMPLRADTWAAIVGDAMQNAVSIEASPDMSIMGHFRELLESFCMDRHRGERWEDIVQGRPFFDSETGKHWFRLRDLIAHLERDGFKFWGRNKVGQVVTDLGGRAGKKIGGGFVNLFWVDDELFNQIEELQLPPTPQEVI